MSGDQTRVFRSAPVLEHLAKVCQLLGINRFFHFLNRKRKRILTYHNVLPDSQFQNRLHEGVSHSESVFRRQIAYLASRFRIGLNLKDPRELTITFDDGYRNQHAIVHPILMQFGIKAYFFCALDLVRGNSPLLIDKLLLWLSYVPAGTYPVRLEPETQPTSLDIQTAADRRRHWLRLHPKIMKSYAAVAPCLYSEFDRCHSFDDIRQRIPPASYTLRFTPILPHALETMKSWGHLVGAHSKTHSPLGSLDSAARDQELQECAQEIGSIYNTAVFSFPFGGIDEVTTEVAKYGFNYAFCNIDQPLPSGMAYCNLMVPRMALPNTCLPAEIDFIVSGAKYFLKYFRLLPRW